MGKEAKVYVLNNTYTEEALAYFWAESKLQCEDRHSEVVDFTLYRSSKLRKVGNEVPE